MFILKCSHSSETTGSWQVTPKPTEVMRASAFRFRDLKQELGLQDFLLPCKTISNNMQLTQTESQTSCATPVGHPIPELKSTDWIQAGYTALI